MGIALRLYCVLHGLVGTPGQCFAVPPVVGEMLTRQQLGTPYGGWVAFQPLYQRIVKEQPDLLD